MKVRTSNLLLVTPLLATAGAMASCAPAPDGASVTDDEIIGVMSSTGEHPEVGQIFITVNGTPAACTATLISPRHFLTAAHCVGYAARFTGGTFAVTLNPPALPPAPPTTSFNIDAIYAFNGNPTAPNPCPPAPAACVNNNGIGIYDIAIGRLTSDVPANIATPAVIADRAPTTGENVTQYGYGCNVFSPPSGSGAKRRKTYAWPPVAVGCPGDSGGPIFLGNAAANGAIAAVGSGGDGVQQDVSGFPHRLKLRIEALIRSLEGGVLEPVEPQTDRAGSNLPGMPITVANSTTCRSRCSADPACKSFSFTGTSCFLKSAVPAATTNAAVTSGVMQRGMEPGFDRPNSNLTTLAGSSSSACRNECARRSACRAYTFDSPSGNCFIKSSAPGGTPNANTTSGLPIAQGLFDMPGNDLPNMPLTGHSVDTCQEACANNASCVAYTLAINTNSCYLKSATTTAVNCSNCLTGIKRSREVNFDRPNNDLPGMPLTISGATNCEAQCYTRSDCMAWSHVTATNKCYLKGGASPPVATTGVTSGIRRGVEPNTNRSGNDLSSSVLADPLPEECQRLCQANSNCRAWTLVTKPSGFNGGTENRCFLKNNIPAPSTAYGMFSGVKGNHLF